MSHNTIEDFLSESDDLIVSLHSHRYNDAVIAIVCPSGSVSKFVDSVEGHNGEREWQLWGLMDSWYPIAAGCSSLDALKNLAIKLEKQRGEWSDVRFGIERVSVAAPYAAQGKFKCKVDTHAKLVESIYAWNHSAEEYPYF